MKMDKRAYTVEVFLEQDDSSFRRVDTFHSTKRYSWYPQTAAQEIRQDILHNDKATWMWEQREKEFKPLPFRVYQDTGGKQIILKITEILKEGESESKFRARPHEVLQPLGKLKHYIPAPKP